MRILKIVSALNNYRFFRDTPSFYCGFKIAHVAARNCITFPIGSLYVGGLGACFIQEAYLRPKKTTITEPVRRCFTIRFPVTESRKSPSFQSSKKSPETLTIFYGWTLTRSICRIRIVLTGPSQIKVTCLLLVKHRYYRLSRAVS